jgi:O-antigen/teichoic acid export membrane protein
MYDRSEERSSQIKQQATDFLVWTTFGVILTKLRSIVFVKLFSNILGASDYGYFSFLHSNAFILGSLISFNMPLAVFRFTSEAYAQNDENKALNILITSIIMCLGFGIASNLLFFLSAIFNIKLFTSENYFLDIAVIGIFGLTVAVDNIILGYFRLKQDKVKYFSLETIIPYFTLIGSVLFGIILNLSVWGLIFGHFAGYFILLVPIVFDFILKAKGGRFNRIEAKKIVLYSYPGMFVIFIGSFTNFVLNISLKELHGNVSLGIYAIALSIANFFGMFDYIVSLSYPTIILRNYDIGNHEYIQHFVNRTTRIYLNLLVGLVFLLTTFSPLLIHIFSSQEFISGAILIPFILTALLFQAINRLTCFGPMVKKRPKIASIFNVTSSFIHLISIIILVPPLGALGAAISLLILHAIRLGMNFNLSQYMYPIKYDKRKLSTLLILAVICFCIGIIFLRDHPFIYFSFGVSFLLFLISTYLLKIVQFKELKHLFTILMEPIARIVKTKRK